ncbi:unnamed protein product [Gongylonema pulchrum]|uniref:Protein kinase domain-containing protein n=1 Tax=Gongylonema pulchrum TaxID=637853 RepID=A0A183E3B9_9BILA|nr:unnamed protein product [Gongylonema pulchrum]
MVNVSGEIKTLLRQLLSGVAHMHDQWILHRDLKSSNLLLSHKGILKFFFNFFFEKNTEHTLCTCVHGRVVHRPALRSRMAY